MAVDVMEVGKERRVSSLNVSAFEDEQDIEYVRHIHDLLDMSLEDVVNCYSDQERRRSRDVKPVGRAEVRAHSTGWPAQLISSLDKYSLYTSASKSRATLTKCGVYPINRWFTDVLGLEQLYTLYQKVDSTARQIPDPFLNKEFIQKLEAPVFSCPEPDDTKNATVALIGWFQSRAIRYGRALGISYITLVGMSYEWWLTTTEQANIDPTNIVHRYCRDAQLLEIYIDERRKELEHLNSVASGRASFVFTPPKIIGGKVVKQSFGT